MITIEEFLTLSIEGYLFCDLDSMAAITPQPPQTAGGCGYPMVSSLVSGCELLGGLVSNITPYDYHNGKLYFIDFWRTYLGAIDARYALSSLAELVYNLVRNGINHTFVAKEGIYISKSARQHHLAMDTINRLLWIDATALYEDFKKAYYQLVKPKLLTGDRADMQGRLNDLVKAYSTDSQTFFANISPQGLAAFPPAPTQQAASFYVATAGFGTASPVTPSPGTPSPIKP